MLQVHCTARVHCKWNHVINFEKIDNATPNKTDQQLYYWKWMQMFVITLYESNTIQSKVVFCSVIACLHCVSI